MKKGNILLSIIILILLVLSVKYLKLAAENNRQQNNADIALKSSLSLAMSGFAVDFNSLSDEDSKQYYYNETMSNMYLSSQLVAFTTYDSKNDNLDVALYNLYKLMEQNEYKNNVMKRSKPIYDNMLRLWQSPIDKDATDNLTKLTEEIRQEK